MASFGDGGDVFPSNTVETFPGKLARSSGYQDSMCSLENVGFVVLPPFFVHRDIVHVLTAYQPWDIFCLLAWAECS